MASIFGRPSLQAPLYPDQPPHLQPKCPKTMLSAGAASPSRLLLWESRMTVNFCFLAQVQGSPFSTGSENTLRTTESHRKSVFLVKSTFQEFRFLRTGKLISNLLAKMRWKGNVISQRWAHSGERHWSVVVPPLPHLYTTSRKTSHSPFRWPSAVRGCPGNGEKEKMLNFASANCTLCCQWRILLQPFLPWLCSLYF